LYAAAVSSTNADHRRLRARLPADELEGLGDGDHIVHPRRDRKRLDFMAAPAAADCGNDGALGTTGNVGLKSGFADALNDVVDLFFGGVVGHVHYHGDDLSIFVFAAKNKSRDSIAALAESLSS